MANNNNFWDYFGNFANPFMIANAVTNSSVSGYDTKRKNNWFKKFVTLGLGSDASEGVSNNELAKWFKDTYGNQITDDDVLKFVSDMDEDTLGSFLQDYYDKTKSDWYGSQYDLDVDSVINALNDLSNVEVGPSLEKYLGNYVDEANAEIDAENEAIEALYDQNLSRQTNAFNAELNNLNRTYNNYAQQVLANDYQKNAALMGTVQSDLERSRRNALEAGANAGLRIANNVNTLLSAQNKQASTSLETSNNLAQAMLNQRNAAASLRGNYNNMLSTDTTNRANLKSGTYERKLNAQNELYNNRYNQYNVANTINAEKNGDYTTNNFYDAYTTYRKANNY